MEQSKYLDRFKALGQEGKAHYNLIGSALLVEKIPEEEMRKGGLIIAKPDSYKDTLADSRPIWVRILVTGSGYYSEDAEGNPQDVPLDTKPGDIALVGRVSVQWFSVFGELEDYDPQTIGITLEEEIKLRFNGEEGFTEAFKILNQDRGSDGAKETTE